jgi:valyl-tRNA synthetase
VRPLAPAAADTCSVPQVWTWVRRYSSTIEQQLRQLGASADWERNVFTLDEDRTAAVNEAFVRYSHQRLRCDCSWLERPDADALSARWCGRLWQEGLIYRSTRLVNWCPKLRTAISEIEVEYDDVEPNGTIVVDEQRVPSGVLHHFVYEVEGGGEVEVATTRLETMIADVAIAVHPEDARHTWLHGRHVVHAISGARLPVICDALLVDPSFGTGVVKVTPAHDANDLECARRHGLQAVNMLNDDGTINAVGGPFEGLDRLVARVPIEALLREKGLYRQRTPHKMRIARCSRSADVIEPLLKPQWSARPPARLCLPALGPISLGLRPVVYRCGCGALCGGTGTCARPRWLPMQTAPCAMARSASCLPHDRPSGIGGSPSRTTGTP